MLLVGPRGLHSGEMPKMGPLSAMPVASGPQPRGVGVGQSDWTRLVWELGKEKQPPIEENGFLLVVSSSPLHPKWCFLTLYSLTLTSRYKKYGTRCSSCWLVPRKSVQPRRLCGRCGVSQDSHLNPAQEL